jgi:LysR family nitrogen assimilation transcriptional regulator
MLRMAMDIRQLRYFIAIVEAGSFSRASEALLIAQPSLSQHVLAMETELGIALLQRNPRGVVATEAGLRLLERARDIEARLTALSDFVRGDAVPDGAVRFGMPATISEQLGVKLIEAGRGLYPKVRIQLSEAMSGFVLDWLRDGVVDLALLYNMADEKGLTLSHALTEEIQLFCSNDMQAMPSGDQITLAAALRLPMILPGETHGLRALIEAAAHGIGKTVEPDIEIDSYRQIKQLTARGLGFGMLPTTAIQQEVREGRFRVWRVTRPAVMRRIYLAYQSNRPLSMASRAIGQLSWNILETLVKAGDWTADWNDQARVHLYPPEK